MENPNLQTFLSKLRNLEKKKDNEWTAYCPYHEADGEKHNNSLSIKHDSDGKIWLNCFNGCRFENIMTSVGLPSRAIYMPKETVKQKITATYDYYDDEGVFVYQIVRMEPGKDGTGKDFRQRRKCPETQKWIYSTKGTTKYPYRLREIMAMPPGEPIIVCEGEKACDYVFEQYGIQTTCNPGGAGRWLKSFGKYLAGHPIIVVPDADEPNKNTGLIVGLDHAQKICNLLLEHCSEICLLDIPGRDEKNGLDDWIRKNKATRQDFEDAVNEHGKDWTPESELVTKVLFEHEVDEDGNPLDPQGVAANILRDIGIINCVRFNDSTGVRLFSEQTKQYTRLRDANFHYSTLLTACGPVVVNKVAASNSDSGPYSLDQVRNAVAIVASMNVIDGENTYGIGFWTFGKTAYVVTPSGTFIQTGDEFEVVFPNVPIGLKQPDVPHEFPWLNPEHLLPIAEQMKTTKQKQQLLKDLQHEFGQWKNIDHADSDLWLSLLSLATLGQSAWGIRPWIWMYGDSNSGKSSFLKTLKAYLGDAGIASADASKAGLTGWIRNNSIAPLLDEFENSKHRNDIIATWMGGGKGGFVQLRGTKSQSRTVRSYDQMLWMSSIQRKQDKESEKNRTISMRVFKAKGDSRKPDEAVMYDLRLRSLAFLAGNFQRVNEVSEAIAQHYSHTDQGYHRQVELYALPASILAAINGWTDEQAIEWFDRQIEGLLGYEIDLAKPQYRLLIEEILNCMVQDSNGSVQTVGSILFGGISTQTTCLNKYGIEMVAWTQASNIAAIRSLHQDYHGQPVVCFDVGEGSNIRNELLKGRESARTNLADILFTTPNTVRCRKRFDSAQRTCIAIPKAILCPVGSDKDEQQKLPYEKAS